MKNCGSCTLSAHSLSPRRQMSFVVSCANLINWSRLPTDLCWEKDSACVLIQSERAIGFRFTWAPPTSVSIIHSCAMGTRTESLWNKFLYSLCPTKGIEFRCQFQGTYAFYWVASIIRFQISCANGTMLKNITLWLWKYICIQDLKIPGTILKKIMKQTARK